MKALPYIDTPYGRFKRVAHSGRYGRMELVSVSRTSDGFLVGCAKIGTGRNAYYHDVLIGESHDKVSNSRRDGESRVLGSTSSEDQSHHGGASPQR